MPWVGTTSLMRLSPFLASLEKKLGIDLRNYVLGSVGKKQFSGDIDVALDLL